jgi:serine/threonine protein kinase
MAPERWRQIEELYHAAQERGRAVLAEAEPELRREVERLLAEDSVGKILDKPAAELLEESAVSQLGMNPGTMLGPYEILAPCGAGGMGAVYKARDTRLGRIVAIKVSVTRFSQRFEREARAIAALQHPHICTLYDVGPNYLVMEYIEGAPIKGPLPIKQALKLAAQIADALDAAHQKNIVHRDLKPANILLSESGIKLLDFGLARVDHPAITQDDATRSITRDGMIIGTVPYMAPEQVHGKQIDERTDIFSFGCVLYELITGQRAFDSADPASVIAAILKDEPAPITGVTSASPAVERVVRKCLAKNPEERWQSAQDLRDELLWIASGEAQNQARASATARHKGERLAWATIVLVLAALSGFALFYMRSSAPADHALSFPLALPETPSLSSDVEKIRQIVPSTPIGWPLTHTFVFRSSFEVLSLSPDGEKILTNVPGKDQKDQLTIYDVATAVSHPLNVTGDVSVFCWYPDSRAIGIKIGNEIRKLDVATGLATTIAEGTAFPWSIDAGGILAEAPGKGILRITPQGGQPKELTKLEPPDTWALAPQVLPGGKRFLFFGYRSSNMSGEIRVGSLEGKPSVTLLTSDSAAIYALGYLLYLKGDTLVAQPFDASRAELTGPARPIIDRVSRRSGAEWYPNVMVSQTGVLLYVHGTRFRQSRLTWFDRSGKSSGTIGEPAEYSNPALSPDGNWLAVSIRDPQLGTRDIWRYDLIRGGSTRFTFDPGDNINPVWSPDGSRIAFTSPRKGARDLYVKNASGAGQEELLLKSEFDKNAEDWSRDGNLLSFNVQNSSAQQPGDDDLWFLLMSTAGPVSRIPQYPVSGRLFHLLSGWQVYRVPLGRIWAL